MNTADLIFNRLNRIDIKKIVCILPFVALFHELEEWNILAWHRAVNTGVPDVTDLHLRVIFIFISLAQFVIVGLSLIPKSRKIMYFILIPVLAITISNGLQHFIWLVQFGSYAPGVIFGSFIGVPLASYVFYRIVKENILQPWYLILFAVVVLADIGQTLMLGNRLDPKIASAMLFGKTFSLILFGK